MDAIQSWLSAILRPEFVDEYFHRLPNSGTNHAADSSELCTWPVIARILGHRDADVMACRGGERYLGQRPECGEEARRLSGEGYTLLIRHAERHDEQLGKLASAFATAFAGEVNVHIYATPADQFGFGWHYDAEDVFILQTSGIKEYSLRKNTVHPWPVMESIPADMHYEREIMPLVRCCLQPGDWLYLPAGYWHMGKARESAISLAVGVLSPAAIDIYDWARQQLLQSLVWRQRLPHLRPHAGSDPAERRREVREMLKLLIRDLTDLYGSEEFVDAVLARFQ